MPEQRSINPSAGRRRTDASERIRRIVRLLSHLRTLAPGKTLTIGSLAADCGCRPRTLYRDLALLAADGWVENAARGVWRLTERGRAFPMAPLTTEDAVALAVASAVLNRPGLPYGAEVRATLSRIAASFSSDMQNLFREAARAIEVPAARRPASEGPDFSPLLQAIQARRTLRLDYHSQTSGRAERRVDPYGITYESDHVYLHGWCHRRLQFLTFRCDRIHGLSVTTQRFTRDEAAWQAYRGQTGVFLGLRGGVPVAVDLRFAPEVAEYAAEPGRWPDDWRVAVESDGAVRVTGTALGTDGILVELLRWRRHVRVLGGPELLRAYREELTAMAAQYGENEKKG